jgi:hypothetical protein
MATIPWPLERRKVSIGTRGRAFGTACIHEHACIRWSMLWLDPTQRERLVEIRDNLTARIGDARAKPGSAKSKDPRHLRLARAEVEPRRVDEVGHVLAFVTGQP